MRESGEFWPLPEGGFSIETAKNRGRLPAEESD
jgi:hypothetical protein